MILFCPAGNKISKNFGNFALLVSLTVIVMFPVIGFLANIPIS
jgi:hypothetical protein